MGIISSKPENADKNDVQLNDNLADQTLGSIGSSVSGSSGSPFQRLKNLSLSNRYERFSVSKTPKTTQSLSMNNLEGELTPRKSPAGPGGSGLKQRLIKALGGYNLLDPRSPSQMIARTPLSFGEKKSSKIENISMGKKNLVLETSIDSRIEQVHEDNEENPYSIFEENLDIEDQMIVRKAESENYQSTPTTTEISIDAFDGLVISKDPRSPSEGVPRTPMAFAVGVLQTPSVEMTQTFTDEIKVKEITTVKSNDTKITTESKQEKSSKTLMKAIYKDLIRRDPIHRNLIQEDENDSENNLSRTTPIKKALGENKERTPLSCVANKNHQINKAAIKPKNLLGNVFEDNFSPKIENMIERGEENTPTQQTGFNGQKQLGRLTSISKNIMLIEAHSKLFSSLIGIQFLIPDSLPFGSPVIANLYFKVLATLSQSPVPPNFSASLYAQFLSGTTAQLLYTQPDIRIARENKFLDNGLII
uniref:CSON014501 protein n=1 Tax=Culicoides sonorensis TaxID=179676 RepID=A0A336MDH5_CULSO